MSPIVTAGDVFAVLEVESPSAAETARMEARIPVAEEWAKTFLRDDFLGVTTPVTYTFYNVRGRVQLPKGGTVTAVRATSYFGGTETTLPASDWYHDGESVFFRGGDLGLPLDEDLTDQLWHRVEVDVTPAASTNPVIKYGIALAAAALYTRSARIGSGVKSESLGDYSYTLAEADASGDPYFAEAKTVLRPYRQRGPLVVP